MDVDEPGGHDHSGRVNEFRVNARFPRRSDVGDRAVFDFHRAATDDSAWCVNISVDKVDDENMSDNTLVKDVIVYGLARDIAITDYGIPDMVDKGSVVDLNATVTNLGSVTEESNLSFNIDSVEMAAANAKLAGRKFTPGKA